jgi:hypothetical protein
MIAVVPARKRTVIHKDMFKIIAIGKPSTEKWNEFFYYLKSKGHLVDFVLVKLLAP